MLWPKMRTGSFQRAICDSGERRVMRMIIMKAHILVEIEIYKMIQVELLRTTKTVIVFMMITVVLTNRASKGHPTATDSGRAQMSEADRPLAVEIITGADIAATVTKDKMVAIITRTIIEIMMTTIMKEGLPEEIWRPEVQQEEEEMVAAEMTATATAMIFIILIGAGTPIIIRAAVPIDSPEITNLGVTSITKATSVIIVIGK